VSARIFLSCPSVLSSSQESAVERWGCIIRRMRMELIPPVQAVTADRLWKTLRENIASAHGALIMGFRQLRVDGGCWRPNTVAPETPATWWPSPWTELEAGMAIMADLPLLALREPGVAGGVLEPALWIPEICGADLDAPADDPIVNEWATQVLHRERATRLLNAIDSASARPYDIAIPEVVQRLGRQ
jgi:hypothetical protein